ncbi:hypothetical protein HGK82_00750 [Ochrobactrum sp. MT180101]|nr:hypothetical protein HGK82_00750 [Ochrobactrum sp. MT180101]
MTQFTTLNAFQHLPLHAFRYVASEQVERLGPVVEATVYRDHGDDAACRLVVTFEKGWTEATTGAPVCMNYNVDLSSGKEIDRLLRALKKAGCKEPLFVVTRIHTWASEAFIAAAKTADPRETELINLRSEAAKLGEQVKDVSHQLWMLSAKLRAFETSTLMPDFKAALVRERHHIDSVHRFPNDQIATFDREGRQMPCFQGKATEILPLLAACGWKGNVQWSEFKERTSP